MHQRDVDTVWLRRYAVLVACSTLALVIAGGLVTSNDAALSIPDWPLNWGRLIPPLQANIRYEFAHRALALIVTLMIGGLAWKLRTKLAWAALGTVLAQAALGGVLVRFVDPAALAVMHATLAQLLFGITVAIACAPKGRDRKGAVGPALIAAPLALLAQTILGAAVRHHIAGLVPHIAGAAIATILVMWAALGTLMANPDDVQLRRRAIALLGHTFTQVALGIAAYIAREAAAGAPQPMPVVVWITVAHTAMGSLVFGSAIALAISAQAWRPAPRMMVTA